MKEKKNLRLVYDNDNCNQQTNRRKSPRNRFSSSFKIILLLCFIIVLILLCGGWVKSYFTQFFVKTIPVKYSVLEDVKDVTFLLIRREKAIASPVAGRFEKICQEGERVAKEAVIGYLVINTGTSLERTERIPIKTPQAGMISYYTDGFENLYNPEVWRNLDLDKVIELEKGLVPVNNGKAKKDDMVEAGERLFKIVDNLAPEYLFTEFELTSDKAFSVGSFIDLNLDEPENPRVKGLVKDIKSKDSGIRVLFEIHKTTRPKETRQIDGSIVIESYKGVVLGNGVLVERDGKTGVYLLDKGLIQWREVNIVGMVNGKTAVEGLASNDWVVTTPGLVSEGQRIFQTTKKGVGSLYE